MRVEKSREVVQKRCEEIGCTAIDVMYWNFHAYRNYQVHTSIDEDNEGLTPPWPRR
jgi:hypothetical protein